MDKVRHEIGTNQHGFFSFCIKIKKKEELSHNNVHCGEFWNGKTYNFCTSLHIYMWFAFENLQKSMWDAIKMGWSHATVISS